MKIFISWSGERSKAVAEILSDWLRCVIQAAKPWVSTDGIDRGALWFNQIMEQLKDTSVGIICLTRENQNAPWILFESGALAKGLSTARVCTLLIDITPADVEDPLAQFNHTLPTQESMWTLVRTLNSRLETLQLDERILDQVFRTYWNQFNEKFKAALEKTKKEASAVKHTERPERSILEDILSATKALEKKVVSLDSEVRDLRSYRIHTEPLSQLSYLTNPSLLPNSSGLVVSSNIASPITGRLVSLADEKKDGNA